MSALLLLEASFPPFNSNPFAEATAREATWGSESGRDSKITSNTPIGTVTCLRLRPEAKRVRLTTRPTLLWLESAICFKPTDRFFSLAGVSESLDSNGFASPPFLASSRSLALASSISDCLVTNRSASVFTQEALCSGVNDCSARPPLLAKIN